MGAFLSALERVRELAERVAAAYGLDIFDVELKREGGQQVLRVFVDRPGRPRQPKTVSASTIALASPRNSARCSTLKT